MDLYILANTVTETREEIMNQKKNKNNLVFKDKAFSWKIRVRILSPGEMTNPAVKKGTRFWTIKVILN